MIKLVVKQRFITSQHVKHLEGAIIQVDQAQAKVYLEKGLVEKYLTPEEVETEVEKADAEKAKADAEAEKANAEKAKPDAEAKKVEAEKPKKEKAK